MRKHKPLLNIAIVRLSALGDIIHSASILPLLLQSLSESYTPQITWFVDSICKEILQDSPCIHHLVALPLKQALKTRNLKLLASIYRTLKRDSFDIALDLQGTLKSALVCRILNAKLHIGFQSPRESLAKMFYQKCIAIPYAEHILLRNATLAFNVFNLQAPSLRTLKEHSQTFLSYTPYAFNNLPEKKILFVLSTSKPNKTYPLASYFTLATLFNKEDLTPIFLSLNALNATHKTAQFINLHNFNLTQIKALIAQMDLVIGGDTGITHLAWALHRPSITLFGATPQERFNLDTTINKHLSAQTKTHYHKNNFSIQTLLPQDIFILAKSLL